MHWNDNACRFLFPQNATQPLALSILDSMSSHRTGPTVAQLGEAGILQILQRSYAGFLSADGVVGIGDDAAVIPAPRGNFVIATDAMNEGHHFMRRWPSGIIDDGYSTGWKLAAQNLSDMNAMGAVTSSLNISLAMPRNTPVTWVAQFGRGIANACRYLGAHETVIAGGDLTGADTLATAITATANLIDQPVLRTAHHDVTGFHLIHTGHAGVAAAGLTVASRGQRENLSRAELIALRGFLRPRPRLDQGPRVATTVAAMMDVSDGLLTDADRIATANGLHAAIDPDWVAATASQLRPVAEHYEVDPTRWVLTGGEDYGLLAVLDPALDLPTGWDIIGTLVTQPQSRPDVTGWEHF